MALIRSLWWKMPAVCAGFTAMAASTHAQSTDNCPPPQNELPSEYDWTDLEGLLDSPENEFQRGAMIIYHKGDVVYWDGFGWWDDDDTCEDMLNHNFNVASLSKAMTAAIALSETEDTTVNATMDDLVKTHITNATNLNAGEFDDGTPPGDGQGLVYDHMTLDDMITMTSGIDPIQAYPLNLLSCVNNDSLLTGSDFKTCGEEMVERDIVEDADPNNDPDYVFEPGEAFSYGPMSWQILGLAILNAYNNSYQGANFTFTDLVEEYLTGPNACHLPNTIITPAGIEWPAGGFETDLFDGGVFAQALLSGQCNGHTLLFPSSLDDMREIKAPLFSSPGDIEVVSTPAKKLDLDFARGVWVFDPPPPAPGETDHSKVYMGIGAFGAIAFYAPERDWAAYLHLNDQLLTGYVDATELITQDGGLAELIDTQADANP